MELRNAIKSVFGETFIMYLQDGPRFLTHGILLCMVLIYGFLPILIFRDFWSFLERVGINHNKCSSSLLLWGRNYDVLDHIQWKYNCEGQNGGNNDGKMMYDYGLDNGELSEHFFVALVPFNLLTSSCYSYMIFSSQTNSS